MRCQEFKEMMDSYLGDELLIETNHEVLRHLENCAACRNGLAARRGLLTQMRSAVKAAPDAQINPVFARRLVTNLRETALRPTVLTNLKSRAFMNSPILATTVAACLLLGVLFGVNYLRNSSPVPENTVAQQNQTNQPFENPRPNESSSAAQFIQTAWREMTRAAVGDHENCALDFRLKEDPITLDEASKKYGKFNKDLDKTVIAAAREIFDGKNSGKNSGDAEIEFLEAHSCVFEGRRFAHVVLRRKKQTISVLVTDADLPNDDGGVESNQTNGTMTAASFMVNQHAVFVVSDLTETENMIVAQTLAPSVRRHIERSKAGA